MSAREARNSATARPKLFIGSSREGVEAARTVEFLLQEDCESCMWSGPSIFALNHSSLEALLELLPSIDFAALVLAPDDLVVSRGKTRRAPRDNVLFELGLFMGHLGRERAFAIVDRERTKLPTDWEGITVATYDSACANLDAALGPACSLLRRQIRKAGLRQNPSSEVSPSSRSAFLTGYYDLHPFHEILDRIRGAQREVFILQTWISSWAELTESLKCSLGLSDAAALDSGVRVRIALVDPQSPVCEARGVHSGKPSGRSRVHAETSILEIMEFKRSLNIPNERLEIRLSAELPTFALFAIDDDIYFTPYLRGLITVQSPCLRFRAGGGFGRWLRDHFDGLWESLTVLPPMAATGL